MSNNMSILKCNNLEKNYNTKKVVQDVSIEVTSEKSSVCLVLMELVRQQLFI
jgi:ABC-type lipopolysaccharide export system ATPase subunit